MDQNHTPLFDALKDYHNRGVIPFDVPGHKHGQGLQELSEYFGERMLQLDVNSMKCLDNLSHPTSVIKEAESLLADAYGADYGFFMVNGTSSSVQAMIMSVCQPGDKIILPRNAHKSATNGMILSGVSPIYVQPEINDKLGIAMGVTVESVGAAIEANPDAKAVFIINPTYYGATSDLKSIIDLAHANNMAVLVDEAHGAHFHFHPELPPSAASLGADLVAASVHKTGGSLTQSSVLLMNEGFVNKKYVRTIINLTQTTSASYLLMTSLDVARKNLALNGEKILSHVLELSRYARNILNETHGLYAFAKELEGTPGVKHFDETKLTINVSGLGLTGFEVYDILRDEYNIQLELGDANNVLAIMSLGDTKEHIDALIDAMKDLSKRFGHQDELTYVHIPMECPINALSPREAFYRDKESVKLKDAIGRVSGESLMAYPPGIPMITPGELITEDIVSYVEFLKEQNTLLTDLEDDNLEYIKVII